MLSMLSMLTARCCSMVSGTSSCSLSSMAVAPSNVTGLKALHFGCGFHHFIVFQCVSFNAFNLRHFILFHSIIIICNIICNIFNIIQLSISWKHQTSTFCSRHPFWFYTFQLFVSTWHITLITPLCLHLTAQLVDPFGPVLNRKRRSLPFPKTVDVQRKRLAPCLGDHRLGFLKPLMPILECQTDLVIFRVWWLIGLIGLPSINADTAFWFPEYHNQR